MIVVRIAITLLVSALFVTGCSKSTSDDPSTVVVVASETSANDGATGSNTDSSVDSVEGATDGPIVEGTLEPARASFELVADKTFRISWEPAQGAQFYRVLENADGLSGFVQISDDLDASTQVFDHRVALYKKVNARYMVQACNANSCMDSEELIASGSFVEAIGYLKSNISDASDSFGFSVALNTDGTVLAVGATGEDGAESGVNGNQEDNSAVGAGAVYVYVRSNGSWQQQAYIKASNTERGDNFGVAVSLSSDGSTLAVGAGREASAASGINGNQSDNTAEGSGAAYIFTNRNGNWQQQAYLKASNTNASDWFGRYISLSGDGNTLAVGAVNEASSSALINADESDNLAPFAGAVYVFTRANTINGTSTIFGRSVALSADGNTLAVGANSEASAATGVNGDQSNNSADISGAVYLFERTDTIDGAGGAGRNWQQHSYIKASNTDQRDAFGQYLSLSADGETLAITAIVESSGATGMDGDQTDNSSRASGAVYVFEKSNRNWQQAAYVKSSNSDSGDLFGTSISLSGDGNTMVVGASEESSAASGINGDQFDNTSLSSGAAYVFERSNGNWRQQAYLKATNNHDQDRFGGEASLSTDGDTLAIGLPFENNGEASIQSGGISSRAGVVYLY